MHETPYGFCECGCGQKTRLAPCTDALKGWIKGEPKRFMQYHGTRTGKPHYIVDEATGCWVWQLQTNHLGYGRVTLSQPRRKVAAHRHYYELHKGPIPEGLELDHLCRNRACVNPDHLEAVTHAENMRRSPQSKLTAEQVAEIRSSSEMGRVLAERFGVHPTTVSQIRRGERWPHEEGR